MHIIRFGQVATVADRNGTVVLDCRSPSYIAIQPVSLPDREGDASIVRSRPGQLVGGDRLTRSMPVAVRSERWRVGLRFILSHEACQASGTRRAPSSHTYSYGRILSRSLGVHVGTSQATAQHSMLRGRHLDSPPAPPKPPLESCLPHTNHFSVQILEGNISITEIMHVVTSSDTLLGKI